MFGVDERALTLAMIQRLNVNLRTLRLWKCNVNQVQHVLIEYGESTHSFVRTGGPANWKQAWSYL